MLSITRALEVVDELIESVSPTTPEKPVEVGFKLSDHFDRVLEEVCDTLVDIQKLYDSARAAKQIVSKNLQPPKTVKLLEKRGINSVLFNLLSFRRELAAALVGIGPKGDESDTSEHSFFVSNVGHTEATQNPTDNHEFGGIFDMD